MLILFLDPGGDPHNEAFYVETSEEEEETPPTSPPLDMKALEEELQAVQLEKKQVAERESKLQAKESKLQYKLRQALQLLKISPRARTQAGSPGEIHFLKSNHE